MSEIRTYVPLGIEKKILASGGGEDELNRAEQIHRRLAELKIHGEDGATKETALLRTDLQKLMGKYETAQA